MPDLPLPAQRLTRLLSRLPPPGEVLARLHPVMKAQAHLIPFGLQRRVMEKVMQEGFREAIADGAFDFLQGRWLSIEITDLKLTWYITKGAHGPVMMSSPVNPDVSIRGNLRDFVELANQDIDPDTLFFRRRLLISGDTDLGLQVKNLMFATEMNGLPRLLSRAMQRLMEYSPSRFGK